jgi:hypothetical protein
MYNRIVGPPTTLELNELGELLRTVPLNLNLCDQKLLLSQFFTVLEYFDKVSGGHVCRKKAWYFEGLGF